MYQSEQIQEIAKALAEAQQELDPAKKNSTNPHLKNRYADIAAVWEAIREVLPKHGLSVTQTMRPREDGKAAVHTLLLHTSGQWIAGECVLPVPKQDPQGFGSAITYARRYSLSAMIGVVSEEDDDGNGASRTTAKGKETPRTEEPAPPKLATKPQLQRIRELLDALNVSDEQSQLDRVNKWLERGKKPFVAAIEELTPGLANDLIKKLSEGANAQ